MTSDETSADVTVRTAGVADAAAIASLCAQLGYSSTAEDIERRLAQASCGPDAAVLVADSRRDGVIGWVHVRALHLLTRDACAELGGLVVDEAWRGRGIGGRLMAAAEDWARRQGLDTLRLRSNVIRDEAHAFYRGRGFASSKTSLLFTKTL
jgi:GNAT superfamily N-acetyltransferase